MVRGKMVREKMREKIQRYCLHISEIWSNDVIH